MPPRLRARHGAAGGDRREAGSVEECEECEECVETGRGTGVAARLATPSHSPAGSPEACGAGGHAQAPVPTFHCTNV
ncbi:hypothetical protein GCM10010206_34650 [Streptomyces cinerochromogenes]|nr:hypothetical protein GCM10010206_34650 [Streptomyces cinerochromogenes]